jgi:hypothetical protein
MALLRVQVILHTVSAIQADFATNTWHFDDGELEPSGIADELIVFYNAVRGAMSPAIAQNGHEIKMYKYSDPEPRVPIYEEVWNFGAAPAGFPLPAEVALVLSYHAEPVSGLSQARRRGRVYIGPLNTGTLATGEGRPSGGTLTTFVNAAEALLAESQLADWTWSTYSTVLNSGAEVYAGWVDNAFDTQRRRGVAPTTRSLWGGGA